jgi:hypothetical protein
MNRYDSTARKLMAIKASPPKLNAVCTQIAPAAPGHERRQLPEPLPQNPKHPEASEAPHRPNRNEQGKYSNSPGSGPHRDELRVVVLHVCNLEDHWQDETHVQCVHC